MPRVQLQSSEITQDIIDAFFAVYNTLNAGFLESIYKKSLTEELMHRGRRVVREAQFEVRYRGAVVGRQRVDLLVDDTVVVEVKSGAALPSFARRQVVNYLCAASLEVGMLLHFGDSPHFYRVYRQPTPQR